MDKPEQFIELMFVPTEEMREVKAAFLAKAQDNPQIDMDALSLAQVLKTVNHTKLTHWWKQDGFKEWFANSAEWRQKLEYAIDVGLDAVMEIFKCKDPKSFGAQVRALEVLARLANKEPARVKEVKVLDKDVQGMDQKQLDDFIKRNLHLLGEKQVG